MPKKSSRIQRMRPAVGHRMSSSAGQKTGQRTSSSPTLILKDWSLEDLAKQQQLHGLHPLPTYSWTSPLDPRTYWRDSYSAPMRIPAMSSYKDQGPLALAATTSQSKSTGIPATQYFPVCQKGVLALRTKGLESMCARCTEMVERLFCLAPLSLSKSSTASSWPYLVQIEVDYNLCMTGTSRTITEIIKTPFLTWVLCFSIDRTWRPLSCTVAQAWTEESTTQPRKWLQVILSTTVRFSFTMLRASQRPVRLGGLPAQSRSPFHEREGSNQKGALLNQIRPGYRAMLRDSIPWKSRSLRTRRAKYTSWNIFETSKGIGTKPVGSHGGWICWNTWALIHVK